MVERTNRTIIEAIRRICGKQTYNWNRYVSTIKSAINSCIHATTGFTPNLLQLGREIPFPTDFLFEDQQDIAEVVNYEGDKPDRKILLSYVRHKRRMCPKIFAAVRKYTGQQQLRQKKQFDKKNSKFFKRAMQRGEPVLVRLESGQKDNKNKISVRWYGPFKILEILKGGRLYKLSNGNLVNGERLKVVKPDVTQLKLNANNELEWAEWQVDTTDIAVTKEQLERLSCSDVNSETASTQVTDKTSNSINSTLPDFVPSSESASIMNQSVSRWGEPFQKEPVNRRKGDEIKQSQRQLFSQFSNKSVANKNGLRRSKRIRSQIQTQPLFSDSDPWSSGSEDNELTAKKKKYTHRNKRVNVLPLQPTRPAYITFKDPGRVTNDDIINIEHWLENLLEEDVKQNLLNIYCGEFGLYVVPYKTGEIWLMAICPVDGDLNLKESFKSQTFNEAWILNSFGLAVDQLDVRRNVVFDAHQYVSKQKCDYKKATEMRTAISELFDEASEMDQLSHPQCVIATSGVANADSKQRGDIIQPTNEN